MTVTAGVIGTNWGRLHVHALRQAGAEVRVLCGRDPEKTRRTAEEDGVPVATTRPEDLRGLDLVVVATPAPTHARLLATFATETVLCEKPLRGPSGPPELPRRTGPAFVNYAFPFLRSARLALRIAGEQGPTERVVIRSRVALDAPFAVDDWFFEVASHPLAYALHAFGEPRAADLERVPQGLRLRIDAAVPIDASLRVGGSPGIHHGVELHGPRGRVSFEGGFVPGAAWRFGPVITEERTYADVEATTGDPWAEANVRAVQAIVDVVRGTRRPEEAMAAGTFDLDRALRVERAYDLGQASRTGRPSS